LDFGGHAVTGAVIIVDMLSPAILGVNFLAKAQAVVDFGANQLRLPDGTIINLRKEKDTNSGRHIEKKSDCAS
jgi:hypothetical protein